MKGADDDSLIVEIAGVAGAGKTTLASAMGAAHPASRSDEPLQLRSVDHLPSVLRSVPRLIPLLARSAARGKIPSWTELKLVIYLMEWPRRLQRHVAYRTGLTIIDQGPVYGLARLGRTERPMSGTEPSSPWWAAVAGAWFDVLDAVIWLDAPNDILQDRVQTRSQDHEVKGRSDAEAMRFIDDYRASYQQVLARMERPGGPVVMRYDTSTQSASAVAADALQRLRSDSDQPGPDAKGASL